MVELQRRDPPGERTVSGIGRFPFVVGRGEADLQVVAAGVWDRHFSVERGEDHAFLLVPSADAPLSVNGEPTSAARPLRNGDLIQCGAVQFQFRLSPTRPKSLVWREQATWVLLTAVLGLEVLIALAWP